MGSDLAGQGNFKEEKQKRIGNDPVVPGFTLPSHPSRQASHAGNVLVKDVTSSPCQRKDSEDLNQSTSPRVFQEILTFYSTSPYYLMRGFILLKHVKKRGISYLCPCQLRVALGFVMPNIEWGFPVLKHSQISPTYLLGSACLQGGWACVLGVVDC